jgi:Na+-driven multidrug efflux pump
VKHTELTVRNYSGFASVVFVLGVVAVGFGAIDLIMIAPKGLSHVAATGQGDLLVTGIYAFFLGVVDVYASRLAIAEGEGGTERRLLVLAGALGLLMIPGQVLGIALGVLTRPVLDLLGQDPAITPLVGDYVGVRTWAIVPVVVYYAISEAL